MPYEQCCNILYAIHTAHPKFSDERKGFGISKALEYEKIRDGELSQEEKAYLSLVVSDFNDPDNQYGGLHIEVADPDKADFTMAVYEIKV